MQNNLKHTRILITGGAGFIGSHLSTCFVEQGALSVVVLDNLATGSELNISHLFKHKNFQFINASITDKQSCLKACQNIDVVLHHAALGSVSRSIEDPISTNEVNVNGFVNMLFAAKEQGVKKFIYASSSSVYGDDETIPKIENKTGNLLSPYAVSKNTNEKYAKVFSDLYGITTIGLRYFNVFGERQNPNGPYAAVIPKFIASIINGKSPSIYGTGSNTRDFTYVKNVVNANLLCIENSNLPKNVVMNIALGGTISVNEIFHQIVNILKSDIKPQYLPERIGEIKNSFADISLAKQALNYVPIATLQEGLINTINWFKSK
ncbi:MAG: NAD-dependent epimerase/dehydratase family protein [Bacteroidetes bacterium]|nr:NAD-dependent epimerase/dehydratase family protein [Bacteroidota bacterium]